MKVIIIGSNGFLGKHLTACLKNDKVEVVGVSSQSNEGIDPNTGLLSDNFKIANCHNGVVIYLSQSPRARQVPQEATHVMAVNSLSAVGVGIAAINAGVKRFIYVSTGTVYAPSFEPLREESPVRRDNWYGLTKLYGEESLNLLRNYIEVIVVRPFALYGPGQVGRLIPNIIETIKKREPVTIQPKIMNDELDGGLKLSLCHVNDAVWAIRFMVYNDVPHLINLASPESLSIKDIANTIGSSIGVNPTFTLSQQVRDGDLIANTELLQDIQNRAYISFREGVMSVLG
jgi:nucleoside-diphosphate-sugar epimerase